MVRHSLKILQQMIQDMSFHFGTLCIKVWRTEDFWFDIKQKIWRVQNSFQPHREYVWLIFGRYFHFLPPWNHQTILAVLKNFAIFLGKHLCWNLFLIKLQALRPATLLKRDSNTGVFLWSLPNFKEKPIVVGVFRGYKMGQISRNRLVKTSECIQKIYTNTLNTSFPA